VGRVGAERNPPSSFPIAADHDPPYEQYRGCPKNDSLSAALNVRRFELSSSAIEKKMEFTALFLSVLAVMAASWWGSHHLALALFSIALVASVAIYLHHATDTLNLSF
jgi:Family of unknown function (DUF5993)